MSPSDPYALTPAQLARALDTIKTIKAWCDGVEAAAVQAMLSGQRVPRYRLALNRPHKRWSDPAEVIGLCKKAKVPINEFAPRELLAPTKLLELLASDPDTYAAVNRFAIRNDAKLVVTNEDNTYYDTLNAADLAAWLGKAAGLIRKLS